MEFRFLFINTTRTWRTYFILPLRFIVFFTQILHFFFLYLSASQYFILMKNFHEVLDFTHNKSTMKLISGLIVLSSILTLSNAQGNRNSIRVSRQSGYPFQPYEGNPNNDIPQNQPGGNQNTPGYPFQPYEGNPNNDIPQNQPGGNQNTPWNGSW